MSRATKRGRQPILEKVSNENYIPTAEEVEEYVRDIGIDPENKPERRRLAKEGIIAPLLPQWSPCQEETDEICFSNSITDHSTWSHPRKELFHHQVAKELSRLQMKKDPKEKKAKKKGPDKIIGALTPVLEPLPSPLCRLPPLRRLNSSGSGPLSRNAPALPGSLSGSQGLQPFRPTTGETDNISKTSSSSIEEGRKRLMREKEERVHLLQEELRREEEEETKKLKEESEDMRKKLRITLEKEKSAEHDRMNAQKKQDTEHLEAELKEQLEAERTRLQGENREKLNALKKKESELQDQADQLELRAKELKSEEDVLQTKIADLNTRKIKAGEEEKEVDRQIELIQESDQLKEELEQAHEVIHRATGERREANEKEKQLIEEQDQLREELTRMREEKCQACEFIQRAREERSEAKEEKEQLREERDQLIEELQKMREGRDQVWEELERMREEKHQVQELIQRVREEMRKAREEGEKRLREEINKARDESRSVKEDKGKLESRVMLLQETCERLRHRVSELEQGEGSPSFGGEQQQGKKNEETTPSSDRNDDALLHLDVSPPLSPLPNIQSNMDKLPSYISSRPTSTHNVCVESESSQVKQIHAALRATQSSITLDSNTVTEDMIRDLLQEVRNVSKLEKGVWRLKEDQNQQLKSVKTQEPLSESLSGVAGERRVTDDVRTGGRPTAPAKVLESLQQISNHFNTVLSTLGSVAQTPHGATPYTAFPLSTNQPHLISSFNPVMHQTHGLGPDSIHPPVSTLLPELSWNWATQKSSAASALFSAPVSSGLKGSDDLIDRQWSQTFPGAAMNPVTSHSMVSTYSSHTPFSKHGNSLCSVEMDGQSLQRQIDSMKMWLESRRKDTSIPLLSRYQVTSSEKDLT